MPYDPTRLIDFLEEVSVETTLSQWTKTFEAAVGKLIPGVARVATTLDLQYCEEVAIEQHSAILHDLLRSQIESIGEGHIPPTREGRPSDMIALDHSQSVVNGEVSTSRDFCDSAGRYIGSIRVWMRSEDSHLLLEVESCFDDLHSIMRHQMSDAIARYQLTHFTSHNIALAAERASSCFGLTYLEREVLMLILCGMNYEQVAARSGVGVNAIRKRVTSLYQKAGCHGILGLIGKLAQRDS